MNYQPVIGIEVHVELNTKTKMFCRCLADYFGKKPNTHTCPVCLGLPGALPYINEEAIKKCIQIGLALGCTINDTSFFERKNYFYPDLPKGYQISQLVKPLNINGSLTLDSGKVIRINRAHQEEDTAKLTHQFGSNKNQETSTNKSQSLIDFNRSGVPLVEIVTEPDFHDSSEVREYAKKLQQIFRYLGVSNADMERGDMRLEANVSVRPVASQAWPGSIALPNYRVELKNINSFRFTVAAIEYEIKRQTEALERGETLRQETRGWNEAKKETYLQRSKEEAHDYRYFPEPDLPQLRDMGQVLNIKGNEIELPAQKIERFQEEFGLSKQQADILANSKTLAEYFEEAVKIGREKNINPTQITNLIINRKIDIKETSPAQIIEEIHGKSTGIISDEEKLKNICQEVITNYPTIVEDFVKGKENALQALIGVVMKKTSGKADAEKVKQILEELLLPS